MSAIEPPDVVSSGETASSLDWVEAILGLVPLPLLLGVPGGVLLGLTDLGDVLEGDNDSLGPVEEGREGAGGGEQDELPSRAVPAHLEAGESLAATGTHAGEPVEREVGPLRVGPVLALGHRDPHGKRSAGEPVGRRIGEGHPTGARLDQQQRERHEPEDGLYPVQAGGSPARTDDVRWLGRAQERKLTLGNRPSAPRLTTSRAAAASEVG